MKKKTLNLAVVLFFSLLSATLFLCCDKDTNCYLEVQVYQGNTENAVSNAQVQVYQMVCDSSDHTYRAGVTDENGIFKVTYAAPAILKVKVTRFLDTIRPDFHVGYDTVLIHTKLVEGETTTAVARMTSDTLWMPISAPTQN